MPTDEQWLQSRSEPRKRYRMVRTEDGWRHAEKVCTAGSFGHKCWHVASLTEADLMATAARKRGGMESNIFSIDKDGMTVHWKIQPKEDAENPLVSLLNNTEMMLAALKQKGYKPDPSKAARKSGGNPNWRPPAPVVVNGVELKCEQCGSDVWDNRQKNVERAAEGKKAMPEFKCKKECGWVKWPDRNEDNGVGDPDELAYA